VRPAFFYATLGSRRARSLAKLLVQASVDVSVARPVAG